MPLIHMNPLPFDTGNAAATETHPGAPRPPPVFCMDRREADLLMETIWTAPACRYGHPFLWHWHWHGLVPTWF